jgi:hypothetical protein
MAENRKLTLDQVAVLLTAMLGKPIARHSVYRAAVGAGVLNDDGSLDERFVTQMAQTYERTYGSRWFRPDYEPKPAA